MTQFDAALKLVLRFEGGRVEDKDDDPSVPLYSEPARSGLTRWTTSTVRTQSGVYALVNTVDMKIYVGATSNFSRRWQRHRKEMEDGSHHNLKLRNAWVKYGESVFRWVILELVSDKNGLAEAEQCWLDKLTPYDNRGYNLCTVAMVTTGYRHTAEARARISAAGIGRKMSERTKAILKARSSDPETRAKISAAKRGKVPIIAVTASAAARIGRPLPPLHRANIGRALRGRTLSSAACTLRSIAMKGRLCGDHRKQYAATSPDGREFFFVGVSQFCREQGLRLSSACSAANGKLKTFSGGWRIRHV